MKIDVLSERASCSHLSWANNFEFEDVIAATCGARVISPTQYWSHTRWEPVTGRLRKGRYRKVRDEGDLGGDLLVVVAMGPPALKMLNALPHWRKRYDTVVAYIPDMYPPSDEMLDMSLVNQLDSLFISYSQMVDRVGSRVSTPVRLLQQAADVLGGLPPRGERPIDVTAFGRQPEDILEVFAEQLSWPRSPMLGWWSSGAVPYSRSPQRDRASFLALLRASKATLCFRFEDTNPHQYQGVSPFTARWFEAAAAGAAILGSQPSCPEASDVTIIQTIPLPTKGEEALAELQARLNDGSAALTAKENLLRACRHHDWRHRAASLFEDLDFEISDQLKNEMQELNMFAEKL
jgi:hypothetical protein